MTENEFRRTIVDSIKNLQTIIKEQKEVDLQILQLLSEVVVKKEDLIEAYDILGDK